LSKICSDEILYIKDKLINKPYIGRRLQKQEIKNKREITERENKTIEMLFERYHVTAFCLGGR